MLTWTYRRTYKHHVRKGTLRRRAPTSDFLFTATMAPSASVMHASLVHHRKLRDADGRYDRLNCVSLGVDVVNASERGGTQCVCVPFIDLVAS